MYPDTTRPPQGDHGHGDLINAVYRAIQAHPNPVQMASYGKILAGLLADQAKFHAAGNANAGTPGPPPQQQGQAMMPSDETPVTDWAAAARGNPPLPLGAQMQLVNPPEQGVSPLLAALRQQLIG